MAADAGKDADDGRKATAGGAEATEAKAIDVEQTPAQTEAPSVSTPQAELTARETALQRVLREQKMHLSVLKVRNGSHGGLFIYGNRSCSDTRPTFAGRQCSLTSRSYRPSVHHTVQHEYLTVLFPYISPTGMHEESR